MADPANWKDACALGKSYSPRNYVAHSGGGLKTSVTGINASAVGLNATVGVVSVSDFAVSQSGVGLQFLTAAVKKLACVAEICEKATKVKSTGTEANTGGVEGDTILLHQSA